MPVPIYDEQGDDPLRWMPGTLISPPAGRDARVAARFPLRSLPNGASLRMPSRTRCRRRLREYADSQEETPQRMGRRLGPQQELAARIEATQPRVAKVERGDASFEMMLLALLVLGVSRREIARVLGAG